MSTYKPLEFGAFETLYLPELSQPELAELLGNESPILVPKSVRMEDLIKGTLGKELQSRLKTYRSNDVTEMLMPGEKGGYGIIGGDTFWERQLTSKGTGDSLTYKGKLDGLIQSQNPDYVPFGYGLGINRENIETQDCKGQILLNNGNILSQAGFSNEGQLILTTNSVRLAMQQLSRAGIEKDQILALSDGEPLNNVMGFNGVILVPYEGGTEEKSLEWVGRLQTSNPNTTFGTLDIIQSGDSMREKGNQEILIKDPMPNFVVTSANPRFVYDPEYQFGLRTEFDLNQLRLRGIEKLTIEKLRQKILYRLQKPKQGSAITAIFNRIDTTKGVGKVTEELAEVMIAWTKIQSENGNRNELVGECADSMFWLVAVLAQVGVSFEEIMQELERRE
jgi:phosphoribosyl-ATP pyrophosphohydrolase